MERLGEVKAIINDDMIIISSDKDLNPDDIVTLYAVIHNEEINESLGIPNIIMPKGKVSIICHQSDNFYLAERFRETKEKRKVVVTQPSPLLTGISHWARNIFPQTQEIIEQVHGPWSAEFDKEKSLNISISSIITIGDLVGRD